MLSRRKIHYRSLNHRQIHTVSRIRPNKIKNGIGSCITRCMLIRVMLFNAVFAAIVQRQ